MVLYLCKVGFACFARKTHSRDCDCDTPHCENDLYPCNYVGVVAEWNLNFD